MAKNYPAHMNSTGVIPKILDKIKVSTTPKRFTQDYLATELGFPGGGSKAFIPLAKKLGLLGSDGAPSDLYKQFRNTNETVSKAAMAAAIKKAYKDVYAKNEYAHSLDRSDLEGLIMEMTGLAKKHAAIRAICGTFEALERPTQTSKRSQKHPKKLPSLTPLSLTLAKMEKVIMMT